MSNHGGRREGAGRPPRFKQAGKRVNIYLPQHQINFLKSEDNMSAKIQAAINRTMEDQARDRIDEMGFSPEQLEFIWADWSNWDEHIAWLLNASREEIVDWINAGR